MIRVHPTHMVDRHKIGLFLCCIYCKATDLKYKDLTLTYFCSASKEQRKEVDLEEMRKGWE